MKNGENRSKRRNVNLDADVILADFAAIPNAGWKALLIIVLYFSIVMSISTATYIISEGNNLITLIVHLLAGFGAAFTANACGIYDIVLRWVTRNVRGWYIYFWLDNNQKLKHKIVWEEPDWGTYGATKVYLVYKLGGWFKKTYVVYPGFTLVKTFKLEKMTNSQIREKLISSQTACIKDARGKKQENALVDILKTIDYFTLLPLQIWHNTVVSLQGQNKLKDARIKMCEEIITNAINFLGTGKGDASRREETLRKILTTSLEVSKGLEKMTSVI